MLVLAWLATGIGSLWMVKEAVAAKAWRQAVSWRTLSVIVFMGMVFLDAVGVCRPWRGLAASRHMARPL